MLTYEKVIVAVFVKESTDVKKYFRLFRFMLLDKITKCFCSSDQAKIETDSFLIKFNVGGINQKGQRAHFVINMMQDQEFDWICALPMTVIHNYLKDDPKWSELF
jgi:hypothetical protein